MSEIKKAPMSGKERSKKFYDENKEKERLRKSEYYKQKRILAGHPPPIPRKTKEPLQPSAPIQPKPTVTGASIRHKQKQPIEPDNELMSSSEFVPVKSIKEIRQSRVKGINIKQMVHKPEPEQVIEASVEPEQVEQVPQNEMSAFEKVTSLIKNVPNETVGNIKFKVDSFKTIIKILKTPLYKAFIKKITTSPKLVIKALKEAEYKPGVKYAIRSVLAYFNCILYLLDQYPDIKITKENKRLYKDQSDILKYVADEQSDEKKQKLAESGALPSYDEYLNKVIETYGDEGREYLITELYKEIKARDDLVMKIVKTKAEAVDDDNYLIITEKPNAEVVINSFKTKQKYGDFEVKLTPELTSLIRDYIKKKKIKYNEYLFNTKSLSVVVGRMNKKLNIVGFGATNLFRKMLETDLENSGPTPEQRLKLANELKHSMATAKKSYIIKKK